MPTGGAPCAEAGTKEHWHCAVCGKNFSDEEGKTELDDVTIPTVSHTLERVYAHAPCTEPGNSAYWKCTVCNKYFSDEDGQEEIEENSWINDDDIDFDEYDEYYEEDNY